ncbi:B2L14 protein, partial [Galbula dea]|nr:B2L14 protein [Galbula dea]
GTKMFSAHDIGMEEILMVDDERDSIEYKILMAYAQRRLPASKYRKLLQKEAGVQTSSFLIRSQGKTDHHRDEYGPGRIVYQSGVTRQSKEHPGYDLPFFHDGAEQGNLILSWQGRFHDQAERLIAFSVSHPPSQSGETPDVSRIADRLAKLVTSRSQEPPSDVSFEAKFQGPSLEGGNSDSVAGNEGKEDDKEEIIQTIVSLLRQSGDELEEKVKKDRAFYQLFTDRLSYNTFKRITDLFLEDVSAVSTRKPGGRVQCMKVALTMEAVTRLSAIDNHPMNLVLGFGLKYLREHFQPWIQDQGGW